MFHGVGSGLLQAEKIDLLRVRHLDHWGLLARCGLHGSSGEHDAETNVSAICLLELARVQPR